MSRALAWPRKQNRPPSLLLSSEHLDRWPWSGLILNAMKPADYVLPGWTFVSMFIIAVTVPPSRADTVTINGVADAEIREFNPDRNFGAGATVVSGGLGSTVGNETRRA